ncbi:hypothetical protein QKU48_gp1019 [Fadolivirus algeromassiliense]|jgi:hypothetical protein|uniref:Uncharacterized protein n=1 Tax=Fadolivirus FV1/VV64 TaxID=3070911 RepID=A0A7D3V927_9VIRU|nr:hypothetical protein QKU48_gp1019 [Fadolivirus algeromassiliense]QKF94477.1 hypothetical protein Fadolivirus_1_1019 [Fadolivirus FV1/VV64]
MAFYHQKNHRYVDRRQTNRCIPKPHNVTNWQKRAALLNAMPVLVKTYPDFDPSNIIHCVVKQLTSQQLPFVSNHSMIHLTFDSNTSSHGSNVCEGVKQIPDMTFGGCLYDYHIVLQHEASFGTSSIGTFGAGPCVCLAGLDKLNGIGFLTHFDSVSQIRISLGSLLCRLQNTYKDKAISFELVLVGGHTGSSEGMIDEIYDFINQDWVQEKIPMTFVGKSILGWSSRSIGVDLTSMKFCDVVPCSTPDVDHRLQCYAMSLQCASFNGKTGVQFV